MMQLIWIRKNAPTMNDASFIRCTLNATSSKKVHSPVCQTCYASSEYRLYLISFDIPNLQG